MSTIITGRFQLQSAAADAFAALGAAGFDKAQIATFFVSPSGHQDRSRTDGDEDAAVGKDGKSNGAISGALIGGALGAGLGLLAIESFGWGAAVAAGGVGAYAGSLVGAVLNMQNKPVTPATAAMTAHLQRQSGMQVATMAAGATEQANAVRILRSHGATDIERPQGNIVAGNWLDFDPLSPLCRITAG